MSQAAKRLFFVEAQEQLLELESIVQSMQPGSPNDESLAALFRIFHTIKGSASIFDFRVIVDFIHQCESELSQLRAQPQLLNQAMLDDLYRQIDQLTRLLQAAETEQLATSSPQIENQTPVTESEWHLSLRFDAQAFQMGIDPAAIIDFLRQQGRILYLQTLLDDLPEWSQYNPLDCYFALELGLQTQLGQDELRQSLSLHSPYLRAEILSKNATNAQFEALATQLSTHPARLMALWQQLGVIALAAESTTKPITFTEQRRGVRVDPDRLDLLIHLVGELILAGEGSNLHAQRLEDEELLQSQHLMNRLLNQLRSQALQLRMVPISDAFERFPRVVRETAESLGKIVRFERLGGQTELDKQIIDQLFDPLLHLIRNALDHGLETVEQRRAAGKPDSGVLTVSARQDAGLIEIEVRDDGRGLDERQIQERAWHLGLIQRDEVLDRERLAQLIFHPGFSTSHEVNALSGRGVGLDVVKRSVEALRGQISLHSEPGLGCVFKLRMPLTLAIVQVFRLRVATAQFIMPVDQIKACFGLRDPKADQLKHIAWQGEMLPLLHLGALFGIASPSAKRRDIAVISHGSQRVGLVVDELCGEMAAVIKPMHELLQQLPCLTGSSTLPDGQMALQLDARQLIELAEQREQDSSRKSPFIIPYGAEVLNGRS